MLLFSYSVVLILEILLSIWMVWRLYPELRFQSQIVNGILGISYLLLTVVCIGSGWTAYISKVNILLVSIVLASINWMFLKSNYSSLVIWQGFYAGTIALLKVPLVLIRGLLQESIWVAINVERSFWEVIWSFAILLVVGAVIWKQGESLFLLLKTLLTENRGVMVVALGLEWCILTYSIETGWQLYETGGVIINLILITATLLSVLFFLVSVLYQKEKNENRMLNVAQGVLQKNMVSMKSFYERYYQRMHDTKHMALYVQNCLETGETNAALEAMQNWTGQLRVAEQKVWTGFHFLDFVINFKRAEMEKDDIAFKLEMNVCHIPMKDADLGVILGNLLDNAIEAARKCEPGKREITLEIKNWNELFLLSVSNSSVQDPTVKNGKFITSKEEKDVHGWGVESVKHVVAHYQGSISFQYDAKHFEVKIMI